MKEISQPASRVNADTKKTEAGFFYANYTLIPHNMRKTYKNTLYLYRSTAKATTNVKAAAYLW